MSTATDVVLLVHESFRREFFLLPGRVEATDAQHAHRRRELRARLATLTSGWLKYCGAVDDALTAIDADGVASEVAARIETQAVLLHERLIIADEMAREWTASPSSRSRLAAELATTAQAVSEYLDDQAPLIAPDSPLRLPQETWSAIVRATISVERAGLLGAVLDGGQRAQDHLVRAMAESPLASIWRHLTNDTRRAAALR